MSTSSLTTVGGTGWEASIALPANHLLAVILGGESLERWLNDSTAETTN
jgi:hypothetical protein